MKIIFVLESSGQRRVYGRFNFMHGVGGHGGQVAQRGGKPLQCASNGSRNLLESWIERLTLCPVQEVCRGAQPHGRQPMGISERAGDVVAANWRGMV